MLADESFLEKFDLGGISSDATVVRCATQAEAALMIKYLNHTGIWSEEDGRVLLSRWKQYKNLTCYHLTQPSWCSDSWYEEHRPGWRIIDFCDIYHNAVECVNDCAKIDYSYDQLFE